MKYIGRGRGEFLALLREQGTQARGIDVNASMVDVGHQHGLDATEADALPYLRARPDGSLGGALARCVGAAVAPELPLSCAFAALVILAVASS